MPVYKRTYIRIPFAIALQHILLKGRRPACHTGNAGTRKYHHHGDLYPYGPGLPAPYPGRIPSPVQKTIKYYLCPQHYCRERKKIQDMQTFKTSKAKENILRKVRLALQEDAIPMPFPEVDKQTTASFFRQPAEDSIAEHFAAEFTRSGATSFFAIPRTICFKT